MAQPSLSDVHIQTALTNISIGYRQSKPSFVERVFPRVVVNKQSDKYYIWDKGQMWRSEVVKRAPGTKFRRANLNITNDTYLSEQHALEYPMPDEIIANQDAAVDLEMAGNDWLYDQQMLKQELSWAEAYMTGSSGWTAGSVAAKWHTTAGNPSLDVTGAARTIRRALGSSASHRLVGLGGTITETALLNNADIKDRVKYTQAATVNAIRQVLANALGLDELIIADREQNTAKEGVAASYAPLIDDDFLVVAVPTNPGLMVPAAGYTFCWDEGGRGDMYIETYRDESTKSDILRSIGYWGFEQTGASLGVLFLDCTD